MKTTSKVTPNLVTLAVVVRLPLADANRHVQNNLASDLPGMAAQTDPNPFNPWDLAASASNPFWVSNNHSGTFTLYDGAGEPFPTSGPLVVSVSAPTGAGSVEHHGLSGSISRNNCLKPANLRPPATLTVCGLSQAEWPVSKALI